jgi:hypothetical protein
MSLYKNHNQLSFRSLMPLLLLVIGMRLWPHPANVTPCLAYAFVCAQYVRRKDVLLSMLLVMMTSDLLLAYAFGYSVFGSWTVFTYSAMLCVAYASSKRLLGMRSQCVCMVSASVAFWCWSNLGVWMFSGMYAHSLHGLLTDYTNALPFLRNQLLGDAAWFVGLQLCFAWQCQRSIRSQLAHAPFVATGGQHHG